MLVLVLALVLVLVPALALSPLALVLSPLALVLLDEKVSVGVGMEYIPRKMPTVTSCE